MPLLSRLLHVLPLVVRHCRSFAIWPVWSVFCLAVAFCWTESARARSLDYSSLEWITCEAQVIAVGKITSATSVKGPGDVIYEDCTLSVSEPIKGSAVGDLKFCCRRLSEDNLAWMASKEDVIVFLHVDDKSHGDEKRLDGLLMPTRELYPPSIFELTKLPHELYTKEATRLTTGGNVLKIVREWSSPTIVRSINSSVLGESAPHLLPDRYVSGLIIPAEEKYRSYFIALAGSQKPYERETAAEELLKYPGDETERVLRDLLKDDTKRDWLFAADTISKVEFGVRTAAYRSLRALGKAVPEMMLNRPPTPEEKRALRASHWRESFTAALADGWQVVTVEDGETRPVAGEDRETTSVIVTCGNGEARCRFRLIPKEWREDPAATGEDLGVNGGTSQGARHFVLEGSLPELVKQKVAKYFGLVPL